VSPGAVTALLHRWRSGDPAAAAEAAAVLYPELRQLARARLACRRDTHLSPTELVHEAFLRLTAQRHPQWVNRAHFFYIAARLMRQVLVDLSRERLALKRNQGRAPLRLERLDTLAPHPAPSLLALDDALQALARIDPRKSQTLELRYFAGMTAGEIAEILQVAPATVSRDLRAARAWLRAHLNPAGGTNP
jgi:RNA polymerase sigma factor (TIGR02999 family)